LCRDGDAREQLEPAAVRSPPSQHGLGQADFGGLSGSDRINRPALGADAVGQGPGHRQVAAEHLVPGRGQRPGSNAGSGPSHHRPHVPRRLGGGDRVPAFSLVFGSAHNAHRSGSGRADEQVLPGVPDRTFIDVGAGTGCEGTELGPRSPPPTTPTRQAWSWSPWEGPCYRKRSCRGGGTTINPATVGRSCHPSPGRADFPSRISGRGAALTDTSPTIECPE